MPDRDRLVLLVASPVASTFSAAAVRAKGLGILLASWPDEDKLVAEIWDGDAYVGHILQRPSGLVAAIAPASAATIEVSLHDLVAALLDASKQLEG